MKVTSVENMNCDIVIVNDDEIYIKNGDDWFVKTGWGSIKEQELESAYQKFKNPPFKIKKISEDIFDLIINGLNISIYGNDITIIELTKALNSLMEGK